MTLPVQKTPLPELIDMKKSAKTTEMMAISFITCFRTICVIASRAGERMQCARVCVCVCLFGAPYFFLDPCDLEMFTHFFFLRVLARVYAHAQCARRPIAVCTCALYAHAQCARRPNAVCTRVCNCSNWSARAPTWTRTRIMSHNVQSRARGILERITDGVAHNSPSVRG